MDIYKLKWTRLQNRILRFLIIKTGSSVNQREIAKALEVSPTAVGKSLIELQKEGLIKVNKQGNINLILIEFNRDNQKAIEYKRTENLKMIYELGLVKFLEDNFPGCTIILFGSYSRGEDITKSDIDIAIIGTKGKAIDTERFDKILEREIIINFYKNWKEIHKNLRDNILNGVLLSGSVDI